MSYTYDYARPAVTVDIIIFKLLNPLEVLLIERKSAPYKNTWAFPGGFVEENESLELAAMRELKEETGLINITLEQLHTFGDYGRDPRGHTVSVVYYGIMQEKILLKAGDDASNVRWFSLNNIPILAFDHKKILDSTLEKIQKSLYQLMKKQIATTKITIVKPAKHLK